MARLIVILLALIASVGAALWLHDQGGFVIVKLGAWTLQTSVLVFAGALLALIVGLNLLINLLRGVLGIPRRLRGWAGNRRQQKARSEFIEGLIRIAEGRHAEAEKLLLKHVERSDAPVLHYLATAVIAQLRGDFEDRDRYLRDADRTSPKAGFAVGLIQARLQLEAGQWEQALASLNYLYERAPRNARVLAMLVEVCQTLGEWERLDTLLPELRRQGVVSDEKAAELSRQIALHRLRWGRQQGLVALERVWQNLPKALREDHQVLAEYVAGQCRFGNDDEAEAVLRARLNKHWDEDLALRYGALSVSTPEKALGQIERWLKERSEDPVLLYAAGRQALRAQLWGPARSYLEAAVARSSRSEAHHALARLLERMGDSEGATRHYRLAAEAAIDAATPAALTDSERQALELAGPRSEPSNV